MSAFPCPRSGVLIAVVLSAATHVCAQGSGAGIIKAEGLPARAAPTDYQAHAQAGPLTVAAESTGHSVLTPEGRLTTDEYVVVEAALFGPPESRVKVSFEDFSIRINGKKSPTPSQSPLLVFHSLKDPELEPPPSELKKQKTSLSTGGHSDGGSTPAPVHIPIEVRRGWEQRVQKASLAEGERALPQAGLIFFPYRGKTEKIQSMELIYAGRDGTATLALEP